MEASDIRFTQPVLSEQDTLLFSAYAFGWGYRGFVVNIAASGAQPHSDCETLDQLLRAFGSDCMRLQEVVLASEPTPEGRRIRLAAGGFRIAHSMKDSS